MLIQYRKGNLSSKWRTFLSSCHMRSTQRTAVLLSTSEWHNLFQNVIFFFPPMSSLECQFHVSLTSSPEDFLLWYQPFLLLPLKLAYELRRKPLGAACRQSLNAHARSRLQWWLWCRDADVLQCISQSTWQDYFFCGWDKEVCQIR